MQLVRSENITVVGNSVFYEERIIEYNDVDLSDCLSIIILAGLVIRFLVTRMVNFCKPVNSDKPVNSAQPCRDSYAMPDGTTQQKLKKVENILSHVMSCKLGEKCKRDDCKHVKMQFYDDIYEYDGSTGDDEDDYSSDDDDSSVSSFISYEHTPRKMGERLARKNRCVSICSSTSSCSSTTTNDSNNCNYKKFLKSCKGCERDCSCNSCDPDWTDAEESDYSDEESSLDDEDEYESDDDGDRSISPTAKDEPTPETTDEKRNSKDDKTYSDIFGNWPYMTTVKLSYLISMLYDSQDWTRPDKKMIKDLHRVLNLKNLKPKFLMEWFKNKRDEIRQKTNPATTDAQRNDNKTAKLRTLSEIEKEQRHRHRLESYMKQNENVQAVLEFLFKSKNWKSPTDHMLKVLKVVTGRKCRVLRNIFNRLAESEKESPVKRKYKKQRKRSGQKIFLTPLFQPEMRKSQKTSSSNSEAPDAGQSSDLHISHLTVKRSVDNKHQTQSTQAPLSAEKEENITGSEGISDPSASPVQSTNVQETSNAPSTENVGNRKTRSYRILLYCAIGVVSFGLIWIIKESF